MTAHPAAAIAHEVLALLRSQNKCLERFAAVTHSFLRARELGGAHLSKLELQRDRHLKAYQLFDERIADLAGSALMDSGLTTDAKDLTLLSSATQSLREALQQVRGELEYELDRKQSLLEQVLSLDRHLVGWIEVEKEKLRSELHATRQGAEHVGKFKSEWIAASGQKIDEKV